MKYSYRKTGLDIPNNYLKDCACGCGTKIWNFIRYDGGRLAEIKYMQNHGCRGRIAYWRFKDVIKARTSRARARQILKHLGRTECEVKNNDCSKALDTHHIDGDPFNNEIKNLALLCRTHHLFADQNKISIEELKNMKLVYYFSKGGRKRRYNWSHV